MELVLKFTLIFALVINGTNFRVSPYMRGYVQRVATLYA
jgi:hypothetical protein